MPNCKTNLISVRGRLRQERGGGERGLGGEGEEKRGRRGTVGPNSHTEMDFLFCPN
jgi:hypothetical protein